jgi:hypothetical protein
MTWRRAVSSGRVLYAVALSLWACAPTQPPKLMGQRITKPVALVVHVSKEAGAQNDLGGTAAMIETLAERLKKEGVESRIFAGPDDHPPPPRIEIQVEAWDVGDRGDRAAAGFWLGPIAGVAGSGKYSVVFSVFREGDQQPVHTERYTGFISGTDETVSTSKGESLGSSIAEVSLGEPPKASR